MGTIAQKGEYLEETKGLIAESINNLGGSITSETTFREYVEELDTIYSNLPKVTGENTEVTLTPTLKGKLGIVEKGNSTQEGIPTPDSPIPIKSVTGNNNVVVSNKNLVTSASVFNNNNLEIYFDKKLLELTTTISFICNANITQGDLSIFNKTTGTSLYYFSKVVSGNANTRVSTTITLTNEQLETIKNSQDNIIIRIYKSNAGFTTITEAQLEQGITATSYEEHKEQTLPLNLGNIELNKIGNYQDYIYKNNDKWYKHEEIGKTTLNQITQIRNTTIFGVTKKYITQVISDMLNIASVNYNFFCNKILKANGVANDYAGYTTYNSFLAMVNDNDTVETVNTKLQGADIYYIKATETDIEITDTQLIEQLENIDKMKSYNGTTIITSTYEENNAQMIISASGLKGE